MRGVEGSLSHRTLTNLIRRRNHMSEQAWKNWYDLAFLCHSSVRHPPCLGPSPTLSILPQSKRWEISCPSTSSKFGTIVVLVNFLNKHALEVYKFHSYK
ncbi:hypothetical protein ACFX2I_041768 [Malus domestica]